MNSKLKNFKSIKSNQLGEKERIVQRLLTQKKISVYEATELLKTKIR